MQIVVGRIGKPHGIRGELTVEVRTDAPEIRFAPGSVLVTDPARVGPITVEAVRWHSGRLLLRVDGVHDRSMAEGLRGVVLTADVPDDEVPDDPEEFFDHQLRGLAVVTTDGIALGVVDDVVHLPYQDLLAVKRDAGREVLVPFVAEMVTDIDVQAGTITVALPEGLLDLDLTDAEHRELDQAAAQERDGAEG